MIIYIYIYSGVAYIYVHKKSGHRESPIFFVQKNQNLSSEELINQYKSYSYVDDSGSELLFLIVFATEKYDMADMVSNPLRN